MTKCSVRAGRFATIGMAAAMGVCGHALGRDEVVIDENAPALGVIPVSPDRVLVRFAPGADEKSIAAAHAKAGVLEVLFTSEVVPGLAAVRVPVGGVRAAIDAYGRGARNGTVVYAEPAYLRAVTAQTTPYGISLVQAPAVWAIPSHPGNRGAGVRVAVLDTGVDLSHPDLPTPVLSRSFISGESVDDLQSHGTHTSGTVLARDNTIGVVGVAPEASLMMGKVLGNSGYGDSAGVIAGVNWAFSNGAKVISMSLGGGGYSSAENDTYSAVTAGGCLVVAAAGNDNSATPSYPGSYTAVVCVAAIDSNSDRAGFSNFGPSVDISGPGVNVQSTIPVISTNVRWSNTDHAAGRLQGGAVVNATGQAIYCGSGLDASEFPAGVSGKIAHVRRGGGTFQLKTQNALNAGAVGVIVSNNAGGAFGGTLNMNVDVPAVSITQADGDTLQAASGVTVTITTSITGHDYANFSGTSMATPHVAGVAAELIGYFAPTVVTPAQLREAMQNSATDLGDPGRDDLFGYGLVNAGAARTYLEGVLPRCVADFDDGSGTGTRDGGVGIEDLLYYLGRYNAGVLAADVDDGSGTATRDGGVGIEDLLYYLARYNLGC